jgi:hypothetical protein
VIRYVALADKTPQWAISADEAAALRGVGLALGLVQLFRESGITPEQGTADGCWAAQQAERAGFPAGVNVWCDLEGKYADVSAATLIGYLNNWASAVSAAGYSPGLYCGPQGKLTGDQLHGLVFQHYWMSAASVPALPGRGYQMYQLLPMTVYHSGFPIAGTLIDIDVVGVDSEGSAPIFWAAPDAAAK